MGLFRNHTYEAGSSPGQDAWRKFKADRLSYFSMWFIAFSSLVCALGYLITPDPTPMANRQNLEIACRKPGFSTSVVWLAQDIQNTEENLFSRMLFGTENMHQMIPVTQAEQKNDSVYVRRFSGMPEVYATRDLQGSDQEYVTKKRFWLGTDRFGRDVLSQIIIGGRVSLSVGLIAVLISLIVGVSLGALAGYFRGWIDEVIMWLINVVWSIPTLLLVIAITFALGRGFWQVFVAVGLTMWVEVARVVRGQILSIREKEYIEAARAMGFSHVRIIRKHILPNVVSPVIVISAANFASAILIEAGLSFLGIGVQPPTPSWGSMIRDNYGYLILDAAHLAILPGIAIMLMVLAFMLTGNGLRDALDVKRT